MKKDWIEKHYVDGHAAGTRAEAAAAMFEAWGRQDLGMRRIFFDNLVAKMLEYAQDQWSWSAESIADVERQLKDSMVRYLERDAHKKNHNRMYQVGDKVEIGYGSSARAYLREKRAYVQAQPGLFVYSGFGYGAYYSVDKVVMDLSTIEAKARAKKEGVVYAYQDSFDAFPAEGVLAA